jgi:hypothetical protein
VLVLSTSISSSVVATVETISSPITAESIAHSTPRKAKWWIHSVRATMFGTLLCCTSYSCLTWWWCHGEVHSTQHAACMPAFPGSLNLALKPLAVGHSCLAHGTLLLQDSASQELSLGLSRTQLVKNSRTSQEPNGSCRTQRIRPFSSLLWGKQPSIEQGKINMKGAEPPSTAAVTLQSHCHASRWDLLWLPHILCTPWHTPTL